MIELTSEDLEACRRVAEDYAKAEEASLATESEPMRRVMRAIPTLLDAMEQCKEMTAACRRYGFADSPFSSNPLECFPSAWIESLAQEHARLRAAVTAVVEGPSPKLESVKHMCGGDPSPEDYFQLGAGVVALQFAALLQRQRKGG